MEKGELDGSKFADGKPAAAMDCTPCVLGNCNQARYYFKRYVHEIKTRILPLRIVLILIYSIAINASVCLGFNIAFAMTTLPNEPSCFTPYPSIQTESTYQITAIQNLAFFCAFPLMGWLADCKLGRGKVIQLSLLLSWLGALLQVISYCIQYSLCGIAVNAAKYGISGIAMLLIVVGSAGFYSNMLAYGVDQLPFAATTQIRVFIHWLVWSIFIGLWFDYMALYYSTIYDSQLMLISSILLSLLFLLL